MIKFQDVVNARSSCSDCNGLGFNLIYDNYLIGWDASHNCPTCYGTTNGVLTFQIPIVVPDGYDYCGVISKRGKKQCLFVEDTYSNAPREIKIPLPYKINQPIPVTCDACEGSGWMWWYEKEAWESSPAADPHDCNSDDTHYTCDDCKGSPETTLTVIDIQVVKTDQWNFSVKALEGLCLTL